MIAITGLGAVSALGSGCDALWRGIEAGRDGIATIARFDTQDFRVSTAATIPRYRETRIENLRAGFQLCREVALEAAREAWADARLDVASAAPAAPAVFDRTRIGLVLGTLFVDATANDDALSAHELTESIAAAMDIDGPRITVATACASSTNAVGLGGDLLRMDDADIVLAGGVDLLNTLVFSGFHALAALSPTTCAPFSEPLGTVLGEGAGFVVLERAQAAERRGARARSWFLGYGLSSDAHHETSPEPSGSGVERAVHNALRSARLSSQDIAYVNAHGTGTEKNDMAEWRGLSRVFGERIDELPLSSSKSFLGHAQGAAGVLELITTILGMERDMVPPTMHFKGPRRFGPRDPIAQDTPRSQRVPYAASVNAGFGGSNAAVVVGKRPEMVRSDDAARPPIRIVGVGAVGGHGIEVAGLMDALESGRDVARCVPDFRLNQVGLRDSRRRIDPLSRYLSAAAALALGDAGLRITRQYRERAGLIAGISRLSSTSVGELNRSIEERGLHRLSATTFPRMLLNAPAGACSRLLELCGPISAVSVGRGSGLMAIVYAAELLARGESADFMVAGGADEIEEPERPGDRAHQTVSSARRGEGGACVLLTSCATWQGRGERAPADASLAVDVRGWAFAGPGQGGRVASRAIARSGLERSAIDTVYCCEDSPLDDTVSRVVMARILGESECFESAAAVVAAVTAIRRGRIESALVFDDRGSSSSCAIVLGRTPPGPNEE